MLLLLLTACGGQTGENGKGDACGEDSATLSALADYAALDGTWSATHTCTSAEAVTFTLSVDPEPAVDCDGVTATTGFAPSWAAAQDLATTIAATQTLSGDGVTLTFADGAFVAATFADGCTLTDVEAP